MPHRFYPHYCTLQDEAWLFNKRNLIHSWQRVVFIRVHATDTS